MSAPPQSGPPLVRARGLVLGYGERAIVRGVSLELRAGEFWCLLGANGSGKTTFVHALLGILAPLAGTLELDPERAAHSRIGFVPQRCEANPALPTTVREFVLLGLVGTGVRGATERRARLAAALARMGLAGLATHDYWALSGGQRQRALVARALIREPSILILDEPMNHLDDRGEESLLRDLTSLHRDAGLTLIFVTHDAALAERHASHVAYFRDGAVVAGRVGEVLGEIARHAPREHAAPVPLESGDDPMRSSAAEPPPR